MDITKSSRHSKIAGDFGETLVLYWLSKYGFECASVDHTGIDLIAGILAGLMSWEFQSKAARGRLARRMML